MKKEHYTPPRTLKRVEILLERNFLGTDVINENTKVESAGQKTETLDMSQTQFNHDWGGIQ